MNPEKKGLTSTSLKYIALLTMLLDHIGVVILWHGYLNHGVPLYIGGIDRTMLVYTCLRKIGRLAFPIFLFTLVQGFRYTHDRKAYGIRLLAFAVISEIPFNLAVADSLTSLKYQNVFWTLLAGFVMMCCLEKWEIREMPKLKKTAGILLICIFFCVLCYLGKTDYSYYGVLSVFILYELRYNRKMQLVYGAISFIWEPFAMLSFLILSVYNGKKGKGMKYLFYVFYPLHLLVLVSVEHIMFP